MPERGGYQRRKYLLFDLLDFSCYDIFFSLCCDNCLFLATLWGQYLKSFFNINQTDVGSCSIKLWFHYYSSVLVNLLEDFNLFKSIYYVIMCILLLL